MKRLVHVFIHDRAPSKPCGCTHKHTKDAKEVSYKGHTIRWNSGRNEFDVYKDGRFVTNAQTLEDAKQQIDSGATRDAAGRVIKRGGGYSLIEGVGPHGGEFGVEKNGSVRWFSSQKLAEEHMHFETEDAEHGAGCDCAGCSNGVRG